MLSLYFSDDKGRHHPNYVLDSTSSPLPSHRHLLIFEVKQLNMDKLEDFVREVSNPVSPMYGKHMSVKEMDDLTANKEGTRTVIDHLVANGISEISLSRNGDYIHATAEIAVWESYFHATFHSFKSKLQASAHVFRALNYELPTQLVPHVGNIFNLMKLPIPIQPRKLKSEDNLEKSAETFQYNGVITPAALNNYYNIFTNDASATQQTVYAALGQHFSNTDLALFQSKNNMTIHPVDFTPTGGHDPTICNDPDTAVYCGEGNLDTQYLMGIARGAKTTYS